MTWLLNLFVFSLSVFIVAKLMPGVKVRGFFTAVAVALVYGIVNFLFYWLLVILALPFVIGTLGLFLVLINAFLLWVTNKLIDGFEVRGFFTTVIASVLISVLNFVLRLILPLSMGGGESADFSGFV
jgi:putative membrane protein